MTNQTKQLVFSMLTENTGAHILDSGGAYGRNWERNQGKTIQDFEDEPEEQFVWEHSYLARTVSVFHYLSQLELDDLCDDFNSLPCDAWDADAEVYGISQEQWDWLQEQGEVKVERVFNTYNGDSDLSQILQGAWLRINGEQYLLLQIHGGCDARGGYTDAKLFRACEDGIIHEYLREYMDSYELEEEVRDGRIEAVDHEGNPISNQELQILMGLSEPEDPGFDHRIEEEQNFIKEEKDGKRLL
jgi:hypothetical protein